MKFNEFTLENQLTLNPNLPQDTYKFFTHGHEMFMIGECRPSNNWVADMTSGTYQKLPDCITEYNGTGTLYYDRPGIKSYLIGGQFSKCISTCSVLDIKTKVFSKAGHLNNPRV